jgi:hypothetical protein
MPTQLRGHFCLSGLAVSDSLVPESGLRAALDWKWAEGQAGAKQKTILRIVFRRERTDIHGSPEYRCLSPKATFERALWAIKRTVN